MTRTLPFTKMHGAGNDFVVLDGIRGALPPLEGLAARLADRNFGIGCDQVLALRPAGEGADFRMDIYNADGSQVEMCANGIRCFYEYLREQGHTQADEVRVETLSGVVVPKRVRPGRVQVNMGTPELAPAKIPTTLAAAGGDGGPVLDVPLELAGQRLTVSCVSIGNPHCVIYVDDVDSAPVETLGPAIETHPAFPNRTNVEFVEVQSRTRLSQRTFERGVGETLACGSGACAAAALSILRGAADDALRVVLRGGELEIAWQGGTSNIFMTGPAQTVFTGAYLLEA